MQLDHFVLRFDKVEDNVAAILVESLAIAEPLLALNALHYGLWVVNTAVGTSMWRQV